MEKVRPWYGQPSDRGRLRNRTEHSDLTSLHGDTFSGPCSDVSYLSHFKNHLTELN